MQDTKTKEDIITYYVQSEIDYKLLWRLRDQLAMHYGFWDKNTHSLPQALKNQNIVMARLASITASDHVLDAGCGVGGSSLFLADTIGCKVTGITIVPGQQASAIEAAKQKNLADRASFQVADYTDTPFPEHTFDVVWAIESVCYANNKRHFLDEAFRILKPGGRLIVADGFATKKNYAGKERQIMNKWLHGWSVTSLDTTRTFCAEATMTGFTEVSSLNYTEAALPSSQLLYRYSLLTLPADWISRKVGLRNEVNRKNVEAARYQYLALRKRLWQYAVVVATKPATS